ncbi:MAG: ATP-binding protein [Chitinophagaceae bacterium]|nr:ATP-binding protein [Chitinophagaceae bacterium]
MKSNKIKSFSVYGLFGTSNVHITFDKNIKILVGENGLGKTQVLNLFYYTLTKDFFRLNEYNFDKLELVFSNEKSIEISKKNVKELVDKIFKHPLVKDVIADIGYAQFEILRNKFAQSNGNWRKIEEQLLFSNSKLRYNYPIRRIFEILEELEIDKFKRTNFALEKCKNDIISEIKGIDIMYFPTFRRVEEDLHNLGYGEDDLNLNQENTLIQFGMDDVQKRFKKIEDNIDKLLKEGLAQFTKDILSVVIDDPTPTESILDKITENDIEIILSRVGNLLPDAQKQAVKDIVSKKQLKNPLSAYLLQKLVDIYEKQKELDNSVKIFRDVCNKYLINKQVFYDESGINIFIKSDLTGKEIQLKHLSSGEKQIISIFSKIYLSDAIKKFIVLFDEPELSLSMTWQKQLLPDIINSKKCEFLLAVTHSPFIFDNELDVYAVGLNEYIKPVKEAFV